MALRLTTTRRRTPNTVHAVPQKVNAPALNTNPASITAPANAWKSDATYQNTVSGANLGRDSALGTLAGARDRALQDAGFRATYASDPAHPGGFVTGITFDPTNPFSRAALLRQSYMQQREGAGNSYAARGQYNSGAYQRALANSHFNQGAAERQLSNSVMDYLGGNLGQANAAIFGAQNTVTAAAPDAIARVAAQWTPPAIGRPAPLPSTAAASKGSTIKSYTPKRRPRVTPSRYTR